LDWVLSVVLVGLGLSVVLVGLGLSVVLVGLGLSVVLVGLELSVVLVGFQSNQDKRESSKKNSKYQLLYTYGCTSVDEPRYARNL